MLSLSLLNLLPQSPKPMVTSMVDLIRELDPERRVPREVTSIRMAVRTKTTPTTTLDRLAMAVGARWTTKNGRAVWTLDLNAQARHLNARREWWRGVLDAWRAEPEPKHAPVDGLLRDLVAARTDSEWITRPLYAFTTWGQPATAAERPLRLDAARIRSYETDVRSLATALTPATLDVMPDYDRSRLASGLLRDTRFGRALFTAYRDFRGDAFSLTVYDPEGRIATWANRQLPYSRKTPVLRLTDAQAATTVPVRPLPADPSREDPIEAVVLPALDTLAAGREIVVPVPDEVVVALRKGPLTLRSVVDAFARAGVSLRLTDEALTGSVDDPAELALRTLPRDALARYLADLGAQDPLRARGEFLARVGDAASASPLDDVYDAGKAPPLSRWLMRVLATLNRAEWGEFLTGSPVSAVRTSARREAAFDLARSGARALSHPTVRDVFLTGTMTFAGGVPAEAKLTLTPSRSLHVKRSGEDWTPLEGLAALLAAQGHRESDLPRILAAPTELGERSDRVITLDYGGGYRHQETIDGIEVTPVARASWNEWPIAYRRALVEALRDEWAQRATGEGIPPR